MKQLPFERPTEHYDEQISSIDEHICSLLKQRKDLSNNNPGFPTFEKISSWSEKYGLYENFVKSLFGLLLNEEHYRPVVEPKGFLKNIPILKAVEKEGSFFSVTFIRQYENASVVNLTIDKDDAEEVPGMRPSYHFFELFLGDTYDCRATGGGGSNAHRIFSFIVSPPLPDNTSGLELGFKQYETPFKTKPTGLEFSMKMD